MRNFKNNDKTRYTQDIKYKKKGQNTNLSWSQYTVQ